MNQECKQLIIIFFRKFATALESDMGPAGPSFENDLMEIVDNPETVWPEDGLVTEWSLVAYGLSYQEMRDIAGEVASERSLTFTTSFIPYDTIKVTFKVETFNQGRKDKND